MDGPSDIDALADALRVDGVVIDRVMGSGEAQDAHDRIAALVREVPFPVYVALVDTPEGLPGGSGLEAGDALAALLNRRLGDGLYLLHTSDSIARAYSYGLGADAARLSLGASSNADKLDDTMQDIGNYRIRTEDYVSVPAFARAEAQVLAAEELVEMAREPANGEYPATLSDEDASVLAERALRSARIADWRPHIEPHVEVRTASNGFTALFGGLTALVVALLVGQTLRGWPRYGRPLPAGAGKQGPRQPPRSIDADHERARARDLADALASSLAKADWDSARDRDVAGRALTARDALEPLLASDDVADLIGAQVLARSGARDLARGLRGSGKDLRTCFFDPRHPGAKARASWRLGDGEVEVPCCTTCGRAVEDGETPDHLIIGSGRAAQPYWERDDVWARTGFGAVTDFLARDVLAERSGER